MSRIYVVVDKQTGAKYLAEADSQHQATSLVVADRYTAQAALSTDVVRLMSQGVPIFHPKKKAVAVVEAQDSISVASAEEAKDSISEAEAEVVALMMNAPVATTPHLSVVPPAQDPIKDAT